MGFDAPARALQCQTLPGTASSESRARQNETITNGEDDAPVGRSLKERLANVIGIPIFAGIWLFCAAQLYWAITSGTVINVMDRGGGGSSIAQDWITHSSNPVAFVCTLILSTFFVLLFAAGAFALASGKYFYGRWRSRQFVDHSIRRSREGARNTQK
jgi:hypothetical protein